MEGEGVFQARRVQGRSDGRKNNTKGRQEALKRQAQRKAPAVDASSPVEAYVIEDNQLRNVNRSFPASVFGVLGS